MRTGHGPAGPDAPASHLCFGPDMRRGAIIKHTRSPVPSLACSPRSLAVRGRCMAVATARRPPSPPQHFFGGAGQDTPRTLPTRPAQHAHPPRLVRPVRTWACAQPEGEGARPEIVSRVSRRIVASPHRFSAGAAHRPPGAWGPCVWPPVCSCGMPRPHRRGPWPAGRVPGKSCFGAHGGFQRDRAAPPRRCFPRKGQHTSPPGPWGPWGRLCAHVGCARSRLVGRWGVWLSSEKTVFWGAWRVPARPNSTPLARFASKRAAHIRRWPWEAVGPRLCSRGRRQRPSCRSMGRAVLLRENRVLGRMAGSSATQQQPLGAFRLGKGSPHRALALGGRGAAFVFPCDRGARGRLVGRRGVRSCSEKHVCWGAWRVPARPNSTRLARFASERAAHDAPWPLGAVGPPLCSRGIRQRPACRSMGRLAVV